MLPSLCVVSCDLVTGFEHAMDGQPGLCLDDCLHAHTHRPRGWGYVVAKSVILINQVVTPLFKTLDCAYCQ